ncbi:VOC family protein [Pararobbsia silviterrae]|uniref:VOC family protein n=1 Tax=Pararobbsia silviterrae TaxID=1792498 RepID=A0A494XT55_9BURK|nr:VOC family protein [Pararobbsia silviterrae]RKP53797.1 VOC family protein [Pararobbsia silviterrae]
MNFVSTRIITDDIRRLVGFYETVVGLVPRWYTDDFAELSTPSCTLAIASTRTMVLFGASAAQGAANRSAIIEFLVEDVDARYDTVRGAGAEIVQAPTTQPWGNRSLLLRDPDGNLVNFFTPVSPDAIAKYAS